MFEFTQQFVLSLQLSHRARLVQLASVAVLLLSPAVAAQPPCDAWPVTAGESVRYAGGAVGDGAVGDGACFALDLPAESLLAVDAVTTLDGARVRLHLESDAAHRSLRTHGDGQLLLAAAGRYRLHVTAEDPRQWLPSFRLLVRATPSVLPWSELGPTLPGEHGELDTELEIDPNLLLAGLDVPGLGTDDGELDTELEIDPNLARLELTSPLTSLLTRLCGQGELDDHGDDVLCATPLTDGVEVQGEIANVYGDDRDVFRFRVEKLATVELRLAGEADVCGELINAAGQRLDMSRSNEPYGRDAYGGLHAFVTLVPGNYGLRVEGCGGAMGSYRVSVGGGVAAAGAGR